MFDSVETVTRDFEPGIGRAVADRTIARMVERSYPETVFLDVEIPRNDETSLHAQVNALAAERGVTISGFHVRKGDDLSLQVTLYVTGERRRETWGEIAERVSLGNCSLNPDDFAVEYPLMKKAMQSGVLLMSGRHLQHGDAQQSTRPGEVFTNCSVAPATFISFYLLLNGSGVGRDYSDRMMALDYANMPIVVPVIDWAHADVTAGIVQARTHDEVEHLYPNRKITTFVVPDSREGWAEAVAEIEAACFAGDRRGEVLILDFSKVRPRGAPIGGMQGRPASGPAPLMSAIENIARLRDANMPAWRSALYADHFLAEVVLVGGARRAARMSTKYWKDKGVLDFIRVKAAGKFLWSSNNSVTVDAEFWKGVRYVREHGKVGASEMDLWASEVFEAACEAAYMDGTGEPGFINVDRFDDRIEDVPSFLDMPSIAKGRLSLPDAVDYMLRDLRVRAVDMPFRMIVNPCGEICIMITGGYCTIADVAFCHARSIEELRDAVKAAVRALIRTNTMSFLFDSEVARTNRIGVGPTGLHEFALKFFGFGWKDLVNEDVSMKFWETLGTLSRAVKSEAAAYSRKLGLATPHTDTTAKPSGTVSKLFSLTEGVHLPAMREYLRWVQFRHDDPLVGVYKARGYPVRELQTYKGTVVVGFPTRPGIMALADELGLSEKVVIAPEATPDEQFEWLRLLEKWWIKGGPAVEKDTGNQISYTLKFYPDRVSFADFQDMMASNMPWVKCVSVMPSGDVSAYEYTPEEAVSRQEYERIASAIESAGAIEESIGREHVECAGGACPITWNEEKKDA